MFGVDVDEISSIAGSERKRRKKKDELDDGFFVLALLCVGSLIGGDCTESARRMTEANLCFKERNFNRAVSLCLQIYREHPRVTMPVVLLSLIHDEMGDHRKAFDYMWVAATVAKKVCDFDFGTITNTNHVRFHHTKDSSLWVRVASKASDLEDWLKATHAYKQVDIDPLRSKTIFNNKKKPFVALIRLFD